MAKLGTNKRRSLDQEHFVAQRYGGRVSPSSGGADTDAGDVRTDVSLIECKVSGIPGRETNQPAPPSCRESLRWLVKINQEAVEEGRIPASAIRWFDVNGEFDSLADVEGWVDVVVRPLLYDAEHEHAEI